MLPSKHQLFPHPAPRLAYQRAGRARRPIGYWRVTTLLAIACAMTLQSGCTGVNSSLNSILASGSWNDHIEAHRNRSCATKAWYRREAYFCNQPYLRDFKDGFIAGYMAILDGKPGCPPTVPPRSTGVGPINRPRGRDAWRPGLRAIPTASRPLATTGWPAGIRCS